MAMLTSIGIAFVGALRWAVKWGVERLTKALDDNTASNREAAASQIAHAKEMSALSTKIDTIADWVHEHTPVESRAYEQPDLSNSSERRRIARERKADLHPEPIPEPLPDGGGYQFSTRKNKGHRQ